MAARRRRQGRRPKGSGSIYRASDGKGFIAALEIDGVLRRRRAPDRATAEARLAELQELRRRRIDIGQGAQTLESWMNAWYELRRGEGLRPRTLADYRRYIETYILPGLGQVRLDALRAEAIQAWLDATRAEIEQAYTDEATGRARFSGVRTVRAAAQVLEMALDLAVERKLIPDNPMVGVRLPRDQPGKIEPLTDAQLAGLLKVARTTRLVALWFAYALLGLRRGEGLGLRWTDLDVEQRTLRITQQVQSIEGRRVVGDPKSGAGERVLPVPAILLELLLEHRGGQQVQRGKRAAMWQEHDLIFCSRDGLPLWPRNVEDDWYALRERARLPDTVKLHHLRHTVSTLLDEVGASEALKAGILGHGKKTVTQRYTHARVEAMRQVLERLVERVLGPLTS
jgi:integrase